ncbi:MAG TPA: ABC transporter permease [Gammaproteobacteria bacterium]|nr:ABC transporter permease [Gammaproteobacteria bacterium]
MKSLFEIYGWPLTTLFSACVALWLTVLIVAPQFFMAELSLRFEDRGDRLTKIVNDLDVLYREKGTKEFDLANGPACNTMGMVNPLMTNESSCTQFGEEDRLRVEQQVHEIEDRIQSLLVEEQNLKKIKAQQFPYSIRNYTAMTGLHAWTLTKTVAFSLIVTLIALAACYPVAYAVALRSGPVKTGILFTALFIPYAVNELMRIYAWLTVFDLHGLLNTLLAIIGIASFASDELIVWYRFPGTVLVVLVYTYILFMVFPIYNTMATLDPNQVEAARDLGAKTWRIHWRIIIPHTKPGIAVGCIMTFMLAAGSFSVPHIITRGLQPKWFTQLIYDKFFESSNWNLGSAYSFTLLLICILFIFAVMASFGVKLRQLAR